MIDLRYIISQFNYGHGGLVLTDGGHYGHGGLQGLEEGEVVGVPHQPQVSLEGLTRCL